MDKNITQPLVSVILPAYNAEKTIKSSIQSVLNQTYKNFELIILDDGSKDNTLEIIKKFKDSRIIIIQNEKNLGLQKTLNKGLFLSRGDYIARIDADDEWIDNKKLEKQINFLETNLDYVMIGGGAIVVNEKGDEIYRFINPSNNKKIKQNILGRCVFIHSSVVFRSKTFKYTNGYNEGSQYQHVEDYKLWLDIGKYGKLHNLPEYLLKYMVSSNQISSKNNKQQIKKSLQLTKEYKNHYPGYKRAIIRGYIRLIIYGYLNLKFIRLLTSKIKVVRNG